MKRGAPATAVLYLPNEILCEDIRSQIAMGRTATLPVRGWSMRPFLEHERDKVLLGAIPSTGLHVGDVVLAKETRGRYVLHRIVEIAADGTCLLWGDGNVTGWEQVAPGEVIGVMRGVYRPVGLRGPEKYFSTTGKAWNRYSQWWMSLSPRGRRCWLLAYRILKKLSIIK